jgi:nucleotide sugar dehydrogenase
LLKNIFLHHTDNVEIVKVMKIVVVGAGKMGLPLACQLAENGGFVTACDTNPEVVSKINKGVPPFEEPMLNEIMTRNLAAGRLKADTETEQAVSHAEMVIIIVPAVLSRRNQIDYSKLITASESVGKGLKAGTLVSYETTVPVGGCRNVLIPILEKRGLKAGKDFYVCFSPERVKSLHVFEHLQKNPKVVGGYDKLSSEKAEDFYKRFLGAPVINVGTLEAAEFVKLAGMVYRDVNIALANELAAYSESAGIDIYRIIEAANTDGEASLLQPGIGVGGHCTPVYPYFLTNDGKRRGVRQRLTELGRIINESQPARNIRRIVEATGPLQGKTVHILGIAFRPEVKEHAYSPAFTLREILIEMGATVTAEDPLYHDEELKHLGFTPAKAGRDRMEVVILNTAHRAFEKPDFPLWHRTGIQVVLDGRNFWRKEEIEQEGLLYFCVGKPNRNTNEIGNIKAE